MMVNQEVIEWIKSQQSQGFSAEQIKSAMIAQGYAQSDVDEAMRAASAPEYVVSAQNTSNSVYQGGSGRGWKIFAVVIITLLLIGIGAGIYFFLTNDNTTYAEREGGGSFADENASYALTNTSTSTSTSTNNGSSGAVARTNTSVNGSCDLGCFESKFSVCQKANYTTAEFQGSTYYYQILGPSTEFCEVKTRMVMNTNSTLVGKEMICKYDHAKQFVQAIQDRSRCSGQLYDLVYKRATNSTSNNTLINSSGNTSSNLSST